MKKVSSPTTATPQADIPPSTSPTPPKISYKYLRRTLNLSPTDTIKLKYINVKRVHIRKLIEADTKYEDSNKMKQFSKDGKALLKKKLFLGLRSLHIYSLFHLDWLQELKHSRNLVQFRCDPTFDSPYQNVIHYMRRINKSLEEVNFSTNSEWWIPFKKREELYRTFRRLYNLKSYGGVSVICDHHVGPTSTYDEFVSLNKWLEKSSKLEDFECHLNELDLSGLWHIMNEEKILKKVTRLEMNLGIFKSENEEEDSDEGSEDDDDDGLLTFFKFEIFPNLKELYIKDGSQLCSYGPFVVEGFKKLGHLQKLSLKIEPAPGTDFFFEGLVYLPQLSSFSLVYNEELESRNWDLLVQFTQSQANLTAFSFSVCMMEVKDKQALEDFLASLGHKPKLQHLTLKSHCLPFKILSNGFKRLVGSDQLKSLHLLAWRRRFSSRNPILPCFQGFYDFLLRNKNTLTQLELDFPLFQQRHLNNSFGNVLSQLTMLKVLSLDISVSSLIYRHSYPQWIFLNKVLHKEGGQEFWNLRLNDILPRLEKLEDLTLKFGGLENCPSERRQFMINCFRVLPSLKNLRRLDFKLPEKGLSSAEIKTINSTLRQLKSLLSISHLNTYVQDVGLRQIVPTVEELQHSQSLRMNLAF